jgi:hypothetical protein
LTTYKCGEQCYKQQFDMDITNYMENVWNDKLTHYVENDLCKNPLIPVDNEYGKIIISNFSPSGIHECDVLFRQLGARNIETFTTHLLHDEFIARMKYKANPQLSIKTLNSYAKYRILRHDNIIDCANYYFQRYKTQFVEHCTKQVVFAWFLEYYNNPANYIDNNMQLTTTELVFANEYIMNIVEKY